jgi:Uncharacterized protein SCO1/SenC/PrrC, involved in biogenesis of respiratory and photosynthetic systems
MKPAAILLLLLFSFGCTRQSKDLPVYGQMPGFQLLDQSGKAFADKDLRGKVCVVNFVFTSCGMTCPMLTRRMKGVQDQLLENFTPEIQQKVQIVSFSVDPERDTPERLLAYAKEYGADARLWVFLTGPLSDITRTVVDGFKISMGKQPVPQQGEAEIFEVVHGEKFVLVDAQGRIRGYYDSDRSGIKRMLSDLKALLKESSA